MEDPYCLPDTRRHLDSEKAFDQLSLEELEILREELDLLLLMTELRIEVLTNIVSVDKVVDNKEGK